MVSHRPMSSRNSRRGSLTHNLFMLEFWKNGFTFGLPEGGFFLGSIERDAGASPPTASFTAFWRCRVALACSCEEVEGLMAVEEDMLGYLNEFFFPMIRAWRVGRSEILFGIQG